MSFLSSKPFKPYWIETHGKTNLDEILIDDFSDWFQFGIECSIDRSTYKVIVGYPNPPVGHVE